MNQALSTFVPLFAFMLLPVWIPMLAISLGWVVDQFSRKDGDTVTARVVAAKEHSRTRHALHVPEVGPSGAVLADAA
ncbi:hypothetical protein F0U44_00825 [Nocardioides humilatus]|uniref:Uncharacterized protein n=1 Tax=Nocardioides humilatus TaxID=2607660 RepID=A0A5B1LJN1_9ACTN|nr:hypothetical protein [Nocardioides humilatus]KAA1420921.1 hypothetical protein F0U44_00825 [Nocardioides humilatus]